ncbi:hypothetical protein CcaverHIS631_0307350 [Cutaneotrichosporon cavernicola]|nr:hypothetical protein CcaverHIS631_0307350 [Cutaneotrichosporon cavernicola]BEJ06209.1 hypothetical protein CcaverHIS641_0307310 [Cutaneotrichosporon cavernicola]
MSSAGLLADITRLRMAALLPPSAREAYLQSSQHDTAAPVAAEHIAPVLAAQVDLNLVQKLAGLSVEEQVAAMDDPNVVAGLLGMPVLGRSSAKPTSAVSTFSKSAAFGVADLRRGLEDVVGRKVYSNVGASRGSNSAQLATTAPPVEAEHSPVHPQSACPSTILQHPALTHITDGVISHLDGPSRLILRLVTKHLCDRVDYDLLADIIITASGITTARGRPPRSDFINYPHLRSAPRTLTIRSLPPNPLTTRLDLLTAITRVRCTQAGLPALWTVRAPTAIIEAVVAPLTQQQWITAPTLRLPTLTHPTNIIYEITYASTSLLLRANPHWTICQGVRRLAVVLKPYVGELAPVPERILCTTTPDSVLAEVINPNDDPELEVGQELVHFENPERSLFDCFPGPIQDTVGFFDKLAAVLGRFARLDLKLVVVGTEALGPAYYTYPVDSFDVKERFREMMRAAISERGVDPKQARKLQQQLSFVTADEWEGW